MRRSGARRAGVAGLLLLPLAIGMTSACSDADDNDSGKDGGDMATTDGLVCGLIDRALVKRVVGDVELEEQGSGITDLERRRLEPSTCLVRDLERFKTFLNVSVGEVADPDSWREQLRTEAEQEPGSVRYTGDLGHGYGVTYDAGSLRDGASVYVVRGQRMIRVTLHHWADATPDERLALAEEMVRDIDKNVTAYDAEHAG